VPGPNRFATWFNSRFEPWDLDQRDDLPFPDLRYFADVMRELDRLTPAAGLGVLATTDLRGPLPMTGDEVLVLCLGDELAVTPRYAQQVGLVAKTMGGSRRRLYVDVRGGRWRRLPVVGAQELIVQARRVPWKTHAAIAAARRGHRSNVLDIPLGVRAYVDVDPVPFGDRRYDVAFAGSLVNDAHEHRRPWASQKLRARQAFIRQVERLQQDLPELAVWLRVVGTYWEGATATGSYAHALADSRIVLCPRGSALDTYRYFEALRAGCIPVYEALPRRDYYDGAPGIRIRDWRDLTAVIAALVADKQALHRHHQESLAWYERWAAPPAMAARIARRLRGG
jgi:hypothetical protein